MENPNNMGLTIVQRCQTPDGTVLNDTRTIYKPRTLDDFRKTYAALFPEEYNNDATFMAVSSECGRAEQEDASIIIAISNEYDWKSVPDDAQVERSDIPPKSVAAGSFVIRVAAQRVCQTFLLTHSTLTSH